MKIDADEKELLKSVERGDWKCAGGGKRERTRYSRYARATFRKDRRLNIRLSSKDGSKRSEERPFTVMAVPPAAKKCRGFKSRPANPISSIQISSRQHLVVAFGTRLPGPPHGCRGSIITTRSSASRQRRRTQPNKKDAH